MLVLCILYNVSVIRLFCLTSRALSDIVIYNMKTKKKTRGNKTLDQNKKKPQQDKVSKAQMKATAKYEKENYDKVLLRLRKKDHIKERIEKAGMSTQGFIVQATLEKLESLGL